MLGDESGESGEMSFCTRDEGVEELLNDGRRWKLKGFDDVDGMGSNGDWLSVFGLSSNNLS